MLDEAIDTARFVAGSDLNLVLIYVVIPIILFACVPIIQKFVPHGFKAIAYLWLITPVFFFGAELNTAYSIHEMYSQAKSGNYQPIFVEIKKATDNITCVCGLR